MIGVALRDPNMKTATNVPSKKRICNESLHELFCLWFYLCLNQILALTVSYIYIPMYLCLGPDNLREHLVIRFAWISRSKFVWSADFSIWYRCGFHKGYFILFVLSYENSLFSWIYKSDEEMCFFETIGEVNLVSTFLCNSFCYQMLH